MLAQLSPSPRGYGEDSYNMDVTMQVTPDVTEHMLFDDKTSTVVSKLRDGSYKNYVTQNLTSVKKRKRMSIFTGPAKGRTIEHVLTESQILRGSPSVIEQSYGSPELPLIMNQRHSLSKRPINL
jgi:hypothetical protein